MNPRHTLALSAVLAATVLTGGAAILGMTSTPSHAVTAPAPAVVQSAPSSPVNWEEAD